MTALDPRALRNAFGSYMTGVTVVTTRGPSGEPFGFTANSFTSVSLDPPMLLVCPGKFLSSHDTFTRSRHFAVNILSEGQEDVSNTFAGFKGDRFARVPHHDDRHGIPLIDGALASFSCTTERVMDAGDHSILIGKVGSFDHVKGRGLGYAGGQYFSLGLERAAVEQPAGSALCGAIVEDGDHVLLERTADGFRPPQTLLSGPGHLRDDLTAALAERGLPVRLQSAYSIFDHDGHRIVYLLANATAPPTAKNIGAVAISDLPDIDYATRPIADMMTRFALESRSRNFGLYLGDDQQGDVHTPPERI